MLFYNTKGFAMSIFRKNLIPNEKKNIANKKYDQGDKFILIDLDNTLIYTSEANNLAYEKALREVFDNAQEILEVMKIYFANKFYKKYISQYRMGSLERLMKNYDKLKKDLKSYNNKTIECHHNFFGERITRDLISLFCLEVYKSEKENNSNIDLNKRLTLNKKINRVIHLKEQYFHQFLFKCKKLININFEEKKLEYRKWEGCNLSHADLFDFDKYLDETDGRKQKPIIDTVYYKDIVLVTKASEQRTLEILEYFNINPSYFHKLIYCKNKEDKYNYALSLLFEYMTEKSIKCNNIFILDDDYNEIEKAKELGVLYKNDLDEYIYNYYDDFLYKNIRLSYLLNNPNFRFEFNLKLDNVIFKDDSRNRNEKQKSIVNILDNTLDLDRDSFITLRFDLLEE